MIANPARVAVRFLAFTLTLVVGLAVMLGVPGSARAAEATVGLGTAASFGVLGGETVTNTGPSVINGLNVGVSPGSAITGFPPGLVTAPGVQHAADPTAATAQADALLAYTDAAGRTPAPANQGLKELGGMTLQPGVYAGDLSLTGTVTLDNTDPEAVFIFQASSTLLIAGSSVVAFTDPEHPSCNVFWQVGSSATIGSSSTFVGTVLAHISVTAETNATITGRLLAATGAVTLDSNVINTPICSVAPTTSSTQATGGETLVSTPSDQGTTPGTGSLLISTPGGPSTSTSTRTTPRTQPSFPTEVPGGSGPVAPISPLKVVGAILAIVGLLLLVGRIPAMRRFTGGLFTMLRPSRGNRSGEHR